MYLPASFYMNCELIRISNEEMQQKQNEPRRLPLPVKWTLSYSTGGSFLEE